MLLCSGHNEINHSLINSSPKICTFSISFLSFFLIQKNKERTCPWSCSPIRTVVGPTIWETRIWSILAISFLSLRSQRCSAVYLQTFILFCWSWIEFVSVPYYQTGNSKVIVKGGLSFNVAHNEPATCISALALWLWGLASKPVYMLDGSMDGSLKRLILPLLLWCCSYKTFQRVTEMQEPTVSTWRSLAGPRQQTA